jgi:hypothetical protein
MTNKIPVVGKRYKLRNQFGRGNGEIVMVVSVEKDFSCKIYHEKSDRVWDEPLPLASFCNICEELPDSNSQKPEEVQVNKTPNPVDLEKKEVNEVERALEELKSELKDWFEGFPDFFLSKPECNHTWAGKRIGDTCDDCDDKFFSKVRPFCQNGVYYTLRKAQSLIDALDAEYMSKPEPKIDIKEERVDPRSIWKDVSELPEGLVDEGIVEWKRGGYSLGMTAHGRFLASAGNVVSSGESVAKFTSLADFINSFEQMQKDIEELKRK